MKLIIIIIFVILFFASIVAILTHQRLVSSGGAINMEMNRVGNPTHQCNSDINHDPLDCNTLSIKKYDNKDNDSHHTITHAKTNDKQKHANANIKRILSELYDIIEETPYYISPRLLDGRPMHTLTAEEIKQLLQSPSVRFVQFCTCKMDTPDDESCHVIFYHDD